MSEINENDDISKSNIDKKPKLSFDAFKPILQKFKDTIQDKKLTKIIQKAKTEVKESETHLESTPEVESEKVQFEQLTNQLKAVWQMLFSLLNKGLEKLTIEPLEKSEIDKVEKLIEMYFEQYNPAIIESIEQNANKIKKLPIIIATSNVIITVIAPRILTFVLNYKPKKGEKSTSVDSGI